MFLEEVRKICPEGPLDKYREYWLILQLRPRTLLAQNIFRLLTGLLNNASDTYLGVGVCGQSDFEAIKISNFIPETLYIVLDEAQLPARLFKKAFRSEAERSIQRPILREILSAWGETASSIIVAGTGLSVTEMKEASNPRIAKAKKWRTRTQTHAFDSSEAHSAYISRYLPPQLVQSDSGRLLLQCCWLWLRGRHRFTVTFLEILIQHLRSPHKLLNQYIFALTSMKPSDTPKCAESEPDIEPVVIAQIRDIAFVDLSKITEDSNIAHRLGNISSLWMLHHGCAILDNNEKEWVELGFARFRNPTDNSGEQAMVDEPLILFASIHHPHTTTSLGLLDLARSALKDVPGRGIRFEELLAVYFAYAFGPNVRLCDVFDFGKDIPDSALLEGVELVELSSDGHHHVNSLNPLTWSPSPLCCRSEDAPETVEWFRKPHTKICFSHSLFGPDIVFFIRLFNGTVLCVIVQSKFRSQTHSSLKDQESSFCTLDPLTFYGHKHLTQPQWAEYRADIISSVGKLNEINDPRWFPNKLPFLRVLATFPAEPHEQCSPVVTTLNMERCIEMMDKGHFLVNLSQFLIQKRTSDKRKEGHPDDVKVKKRQRQ